MKRLHSITPLFSILAGTLLLAGCQPRPDGSAAVKPEPEPTVTIQTSVAAMRPVPSFLEATGELKGGRVSSVAADASGKVRETLVERGSVVKAGDVLVKLDDRAATLSLREAEAALAQTKARVGLARSDWQRNEALARQKMISTAEAQKFEADALGRESDVAAAEARRDSAQKTLDDTEVRAPFAGTVAERCINDGEYVQAGAKVAVMIATDDLRLWINVPEVAAGSIRQGQAVTFRVPAFPGIDFTAKVRFISPIVRETGRDLLVEAEVETTAEHRLMQGMFAEVRLSQAERPGLMIPTSALRKEGSVHKVLVPEGDFLAERIVEVGVSTDAWTEIRNGLAEGESVVVQPSRNSRDGTRFIVAVR